MGDLAVSASSFVKWKHEYLWSDVILKTKMTVDGIGLVQWTGHITIYWWRKGTKCREAGPKQLAGNDSKDLKSVKETLTYPGPPASLFHLCSDPAETLTGCSCDILKGCLMAVPSVIKQQTVYYCLVLSLFLVGARKGRGCHRMMYGPQDKRPVHQCLTSRA